MTKQVSELKQGDKIYGISRNWSVSYYTYLCVHPNGGGNYHILITGGGEEPVRVHHTHLQEILNLGFNSYQDAKIGLAANMETYAAILKKEDPSL